MPDVYGDIEGFAFQDAAQLGLRMLQLIMKTAQRPFPGTRVVILNEAIVDAQLGEPRAMVGLYEKSASIPQDLRTQLPDAWERGIESLQRYWPPVGIKEQVRRAIYFRRTVETRLQTITARNQGRDFGPDWAMAWREASRFS